MTVTVDVERSLEFVELSHFWGHGVPVWPGDADVKIERSVKHATHGVMSQTIVANMHVATHVDAPAYLVQDGSFVGDLPINRFFGAGVIWSVPKGKWQLITVEDLEAATPKAQPCEMVMIVTGWGTRFSDSQDYFGNAPGLTQDAAEWLVQQGVTMVGIDTAAIDHPLATSLGAHRGGPTMRRLPQRYETETGTNPKKAFPLLYPAARTLLRAGIPIVLNVGGEIATLVGRRVTLHAMPWRWTDGESCVIRLVAILDPGGAYRIESGEAG